MVEQVSGMVRGLNPRGLASKPVLGLILVIVAAIGYFGWSAVSGSDEPEVAGSTGVTTTVVDSVEELPADNCGRVRSWLGRCDDEEEAASTNFGTNNSQNLNFAAPTDSHQQAVPASAETLYCESMTGGGSFPRGAVNRKYENSAGVVVVCCPESHGWYNLGNGYRFDGASSTTTPPSEPWTGELAPQVCPALIPQN